MIKIWHIQGTHFKVSYKFLFYFLDCNLIEKSVGAKIVRFAYIPKKTDNPNRFFWLKISGKSVLCTIQRNCFYFWDFDCSLACIRSSIINELIFNDKILILESSISDSYLYLFNEKNSFIQFSEINVFILFLILGFLLI